MEPEFGCRGFPDTGVRGAEGSFTAPVAKAMGAREGRDPPSRYALWRTSHPAIRGPRDGRFVRILSGRTKGRAFCQDIERRQFARDPVWTESIAVGSESFVSDIASELWNREELDLSENHGVGWVLRETGAEYTTGHLNDTR